MQETWLFPWDLAVPSTLGIDLNSFSLSSIDVTNGIKAGRSYVVVVVVVGNTVRSISSKTLAYDCLYTLELCTASMIASS